MDSENIVPENYPLPLQNDIDRGATQAKELISASKTLYVIPDSRPEAQACALGLFYVLKESGKNANLLLDNLPENLKFLSPSLEFVSYPKNFVISVPNRTAEVSQIYYEKTDEDVKIHLTVEKGNIRKEDLSFYFAETKADAIITVGVRNYTDRLASDLNSFGFLLDSPILNIDNGAENTQFGKINMVHEQPLAQQAMKLSENISQQTAKCLLTSLVLRTNNFTKKVTPEIFELAAQLMKRGVNIQEITDNLSKSSVSVKSV